MRIDHIGYAVKNIEKAQKGFISLGYTFDPIVQDDDRGIYISFGRPVEGARIELLSPIAPGNGSPIDGILAKNGSTPYHICYHSANIEEDIQRLVKERFKITVPLAEAKAFGGRRVVFMYSLAVGLIEIVED